MVTEGGLELIGSIAEFTSVDEEGVGAEGAGAEVIGAKRGVVSVCGEKLSP